MCAKASALNSGEEWQRLQSRFSSGNTRASRASLLFCPAFCMLHLITKKRQCLRSMLHGVQGLHTWVPVELIQSSTQRQEWQAPVAAPAHLLLVASQGCLPG